MYAAQVDQSGRIELTQKHTVVAFANGISSSLYISAKEKRKVFISLGQTKTHLSKTLLRVYVFSTLLFLLLEEHINNLSEITIDHEYEGYAPVIKDRIMTLCRKHGIEIYSDQIAFNYIGKKSPAHNLAIKVFRGEARPDKVVKARDILREFET